MRHNVLLFGNMQTLVLTNFAFFAKTE